MKIISDLSVTLVDALSGWGLRECTEKYPGIQVPADVSQRTILGMEIVLRHVPQLIARILTAEPLAPTDPRGAFRALFDPEDVDNLLLHDGRQLADYPIDEEVRRRVETPDFSPIVCTVQVAKNDPGYFIGKFVIFDGWHRSAAWLIRTAHGHSQRLTADVIRTIHPLIHPTA